MEGYTTQLVPPQENKKNSFISRKTESVFKFRKASEHLLIFLVLLFFTINVALVFVNFSIFSRGIDGIPVPNFTASIINIMNPF